MATGQLVRSTTDRKIAGVCGGLAAHFNIDPTLMRIMWVVAVLAGFGLGALIYLVLWVALPEGEPGPRTTGAVQIAEERYARGEISAEELARIRADLGAR
jgi:phage shock protein C